MRYKKIVLKIVLLLIVFFGFNLSIKGEEAFKGKNSPAFKKSADCSKNGKYLFVMFYKDTSDSVTREMEEIFKQAEASHGKKADFIKINIADNAEREFINFYQINRIAKPVVISIAPGGIVTKGFIRKIALEEINSAFVTPKTLEMIKANAEKKLIILFFCNDSMQDSGKAESIVNKVVKELSSQTPLQVIKIDPNNKEEEGLLKQAKVSKDIKSPVIVIMQSGAIKGTLEIAKLTEQSLKDLITASCGPGGCGPGG